MKTRYRRSKTALILERQSVYERRSFGLHERFYNDLTEWMASLMIRANLRPANKCEEFKHTHTHTHTHIYIYICIHSQRSGQGCGHQTDKEFIHTRTYTHTHTTHTTHASTYDDQSKVMALNGQELYTHTYIYTHNDQSQVMTIKWTRSSTYTHTDTHTQTQ